MTIILHEYWYSCAKYTTNWLWYGYTILPVLTIMTCINCVKSQLCRNYYTAAINSKLLPLLLSTLSRPIVVTQEPGHGTPPAMGQQSTPRTTLRLILTTFHGKLWTLLELVILWKISQDWGTKSGNKRGCWDEGNNNSGICFDWGPVNCFCC